jgi:hypothetical protein
MSKVALLALAFLFAVPAYADFYTLEFFTEQGPAPTSSGFEYDTLGGRFLTQIHVAWDIVPDVGFSPWQFGRTGIQGCPGNNLDQAWFALLTGSCGTVHWAFDLYNDGFKYELQTVLRSDLEIISVNAAGIGVPVTTTPPRIASARGTVAAHPAVAAVPEPATVTLLFVGLAGVLIVGRMHLRKVKLLPKLVVFFLLMLPGSAFADFYTIEFFTQEGPAPTSAGFEADPVLGAFLTLPTVPWDIVPEFTLFPFGPPVPSQTIPGCPGNIGPAYFALLTGQCGTATFRFQLNYKTVEPFQSYETYVHIGNGTSGISTNIIGFTSEIAKRSVVSSGTMRATLATDVHTVPEAASIAFLLPGLAGLLCFACSYRRHA